ncbi:hypothetical protein GCM10027294_44480 [Marinactinospora endophytica]
MEGSCPAASACPAVDTPTHTEANTPARTERNLGSADTVPPSSHPPARGRQGVADGGHAASRHAPATPPGRTGPA